MKMVMSRMGSGLIEPGKMVSLCTRSDREFRITKVAGTQIDSTFDLAQIFVNNHEQLVISVPFEFLEHIGFAYMERGSEGSEIRLDVVNTGHEAGKVIVAVAMAMEAKEEQT